MNETIKLSHQLGGYNETIFGQPLGDNVAVLINIPHALNIGKGDIVEYDEKLCIIRVICRGTKTAGGKYKPKNGLIKAISFQHELTDHLKRFSIEIEFISDNMFSMSVPLNMTTQKLQEIVRDCPMQFDLYLERK